MATIQYVVNAVDAASATFERIAGSAEHVLEKLDDIGKKTARARVELKGNEEAELKIDQLDLKMAKFAKRVAEGKLGVDGGAAAILQIRKAEAELDRFGRKDVTAKIHIDTSALSKLSLFKPSLKGAALALSPALIPLTAQLAAGAAAIAVSFGAAAVGVGAFGLMAKTVLTGAGQDLQKLQTLNVALLKATTPAAKKAAEQAIAALKAGWSKGYLELIDNYKTFQEKWKSVSQAITVPALNAWLPALTRGLQFLAPALKPVADLMLGLGKTLDAYFANNAPRIRELAAAFGQFAALQLADVVRFVTDLAKGIFNLGKDLAANGANFGAAGTWLAKIGDGFLAWSKSKKARDDVHGFMKFIHDDGPLVKGILKDLGTLLPGIFKGATTVGQLELEALGGFLNLVANLPKGWQAPITEFAGAMLLLSKIGVVKVGLKLTGLGGALPGLAGAGAAGGPLAGAGAAIAAGLVLRIREDLKKGISAIAADLPKWLSGIGGVIQLSAGGWADAIVNHFEKPVKESEHAFGHLLAADLRTSWDIIANNIRTFGHTAAGIWSTIWDNTTALARHGVAAVVGAYRTVTGLIGSVLATLRRNIASAWSTIWANTRNAVTAGISTVIGFFRTIPGRAVAALFGLGHGLAAFASAAFREMLRAIQNVAGSIWSWLTSWVSRLPGWLKHLLGIKSPSSVFYDIGRQMMMGLFQGIKDHAHHARDAAMTSVGNIRYSPGAGVSQWGPLVRRVLIMEGLNPLMAAQVMFQIQTESGGNPNAINLTDINAQRGDPSRGLLQTIGSTFRAYHWPGTSNNIYDPLANIAAAVNYARHVYGPTLMSGGMGLGSGHGYDSGGWLPVGASVAVNRTGQPEQVVGPASMAQVVALLAQILAAVRIAPAATSAGTARALNSAARGAIR